MAGLNRAVAFTALCLLLGGCGNTDEISSSPTPTTADGATVPPAQMSPSSTATPSFISDCPREMPKPSGTDPAGAFVPSDPVDVLVCRYEHPTWKLTGRRVLPRSEATRLAAELNRAEEPERGFHCPSTLVWEAWVFRGASQVVVKAGWCNLVVGQGRAVKAPLGWFTP